MKKVFFFLFFMQIQSVFGQFVDSTYLLVFKNKERKYGQIPAENDSIIFLKSPKKKYFEIPKSSLKRKKLLSPEPNLHYFVHSNGVPLRKGEFRIQNGDIFYNHVEMGITNRLAVQGNFAFFGGSIGLRAHVFQKDKWSGILGGGFFNIVDFTEFDTKWFGFKPYATWALTYGTSARQFTIGSFWVSPDLNETFLPVPQFGALHRLIGNSYFIFELKPGYVNEYAEGVTMTGLRFKMKRYALDVALIKYFDTDVLFDFGYFYFGEELLPWLSVNYQFTKRGQKTDLMPFSWKKQR
jgi:hypothetical protein